MTVEMRGQTEGSLRERAETARQFTVMVDRERADKNKKAVEGFISEVDAFLKGKGFTNAISREVRTMAEAGLLTMQKDTKLASFWNAFFPLARTAEQERKKEGPDQICMLCAKKFTFIEGINSTLRRHAETATIAHHGPAMHRLLEFCFLACRAAGEKGKTAAYRQRCPSCR